MIREEELCPSCGGTGKCSYCKGAGREKCPKCKGEGYYKSGFYYYGCEKCRGSGRLGETAYPEKLRTSKDIVLGVGGFKCSHCRGTGVCPSYMGYRKKIK